MDVLIYGAVLFAGLMALYPFVTTVAVSLNDGLDSSRGGLIIWPRDFTTDNYRVVLADSRLATAVVVTTLRTVLGTSLTLIVTGLFAYAMSKRHLRFRGLYMTLCLISMYFNGGLIPRFVLYQSLGLTNNFLVYVVPHAINVFHMIIMMTFFRTVPAELEESATIDGAGDFRVLLQIFVPVSMPVIAVIVLYNAVFQWNQWFDAYLFVSDRSLHPLQNILVDIINVQKVDEMTAEAQAFANQMLENQSNLTGRSVTAAAMVITIGPIIFIYPFLQRYFVKGIMIGSVKG